MLKIEDMGGDLNTESEASAHARSHIERARDLLRSNSASLYV
jgi:hypothetical protein